MAILRINKTKDYTIMSNEHLKNKNLSLKAKGLLSVMLSLPNDWDYSIAGLVAISKENETAIKSTLLELKQYGYLVVRKFMPNETKTGRIEYIYDIFETSKQEHKKQELENLGVEFLDVENQGQLNTNELNTKKQNRVKFTPPTLEEVKEYAKSINRLDLAVNFYNYYTKFNWVDGNGKRVKRWKQKFYTWCSYGNKGMKDKNFKGRQYDEKELNAMFNDIDNIVV